MKNYDLAIIGSGPGGYIAALYASRYKLKICVIEKELLGGTCLNKGCIPTKVMLNSARILSEVKDSSKHGIDVASYKVDFFKILSRRDEVVTRLRTGIETLLRARRIDVLKGAARIKDAGTLTVEGSDIGASQIIIAVGSRPKGLSGIKIDEENILSSDGALGLEAVPKSMLVIGGGVIGCEFASLFNALGSKVTIVEVLDRIIATQSQEASKKLEVIFKRRGIDVLVSSKVESIVNEKVVKVRISGAGEVQTEKVLISVGRIPNTEGLGLEELGVKMEGGRILTDDKLRTSARKVYAIGDCIGAPLLAHKASYEGILACDNIMGKERSVDYSSIPNCIYTDPEIASVGMSEDEARAKCADIKVAKFPYLGSGKAYLLGKTEGFIKIIGNAEGLLLGAEIMGEGACDLIGEATIAKKAGVKITELRHVVHGHPTLSEIFNEVSNIFCGTGIHAA